MASVALKPGREKSLLRRHPWIFSGAVQRVEGEAVPGGTVDLLSFNQDFLARAAYSPTSQIRARVWTFEDEPVDKEFFRKRIHSAIQSRDTWHPSRASGQRLKPDTNAYRLIYAESDGIPGLIVDRYGDVLVLQSLTAGSEFWKETLADLLLEETGLTTIYERSDADVRELEGLEPNVGSLRGHLSSIVFPITEHNLKFNVNLQSGHKTGFYLDQRLNRLRMRELAKDKDVLDGFCYTGGFTVNALAGGATSVISIDSSAEALELLRENIALNNLEAARQSSFGGDVFQLLRKFRDERRSFDMVILDPPKFAPTAAQAERAARGYKDINLLAFKLLRPGGVLVTFSCSGGIDAGLFQKIVAGAALDAGVEAQIVEHLFQGADHPVALNFPEGEYLKGLICLRK
ncbi:MAG TPA: class I SAM-dependent methyltransferase [Anaerolineales bacterium]|nr:class I SAM-dependent methyltransferase [Anaerolineales bacterium]